MDRVQSLLGWADPCDMIDRSLSNGLSTPPFDSSPSARLNVFMLLAEQKRIETF